MDRRSSWSRGVTHPSGRQGPWQPVEKNSSRVGEIIAGQPFARGFEVAK